MKLVLFLKHWRLIVSTLTALVVGFGAAWWIQGIRVEYGKSEISNLKSQIESCQLANKTNQETISNLKSEIKKSQRLCRARLTVRDRTIKRLKEIDSLKGNEKGKGEKGIDAVDDPILHELNRMFNKNNSKD